MTKKKTLKELAKELEPTSTVKEQEEVQTSEPVDTDTAHPSPDAVESKQLKLEKIKPSPGPSGFTHDDNCECHVCRIRRRKEYDPIPPEARKSVIVTNGLAYFEGPWELNEVLKKLHDKGLLHKMEV